MKKFAVYTLGFFVPVIAYWALSNAWWRATRFEARTADGWIYVVDRRTGEVTSCLERTCQVIKAATEAAASAVPGPISR